MSDERSVIIGDIITTIKSKYFYVVHDIHRRNIVDINGNDTYLSLIYYAVDLRDFNSAIFHYNLSVKDDFHVKDVIENIHNLGAKSYYVSGKNSVIRFGNVFKILRDKPTFLFSDL